MIVTGVTDEDTATWLRLAGVGLVHAVSTPEDGGSILKKLLKNPEVGIILISSEVAAANESIVTEALKLSKPILLEIPTEAQKDEDPLKELIRFAVGVDIAI
ncbi:MAG: V-type ATP synthase subunit F [Promethearchaeota archaeon]